MKKNGEKAVKRVYHFFRTAAENPDIVEKAWQFFNQRFFRLKRFVYYYQIFTFSKVLSLCSIPEMDRAEMGLIFANQFPDPDMMDEEIDDLLLRNLPTLFREYLKKFNDAIEKNERMLRNCQEGFFPGSQTRKRPSSLSSPEVKRRKSSSSDSWGFD